MGDSRLDYLFHHIFFPTPLPQRSDTHNGQGDQALVDALLESLDSFRRTNDVKYYQPWSVIYNIPVQPSLTVCRSGPPSNALCGRSSYCTAGRNRCPAPLLRLSFVTRQTAKSSYSTSLCRIPQSLYRDKRKNTSSRALKHQLSRLTYSLRQEHWNGTFPVER